MAVDVDTLGSLLATANALAEEAGKLILDFREDARRRPDTKSDKNDLVTEADRAAERLISEGIKSARPDDGIIGEEGQRHNPESNVQWLIDPIDGTTNYVHGSGPFAVSIGVEIDGTPVVGVINSASTSEVFTAALGRGAYCNGELIKTSAATSLATALVGLDCSTNKQVRERQLQLLGRLMTDVREIRRLGSCAYEMCLVAAGRLDAAVNHGGGPWDYSAGTIIAREGGAFVNVRKPDAITGAETWAVAPGIRDAFQDVMDAYI
jgi:myo-inositol-1(or 4)-monophosphatase